MSILGSNWLEDEQESKIFSHWNENENKVILNKNRDNDEITIFSHWKEDNINSEFDLFIKHFRDY